MGREDRFDGVEVGGGEVGWEVDLGCCMQPRAEDTEHHGTSNAVCCPPTPVPPPTPAAGMTPAFV